MPWDPHLAEVRRAGGVATLPGLQPGDSWLQPARSRAPDRAVTNLIAGCIALVALINPKGPANTAPWDAIALLTLFGVVLWALRHRPVLHVPYAWPMTGVMLTGLVATFASLDVRGSTVAVLQE